MVLTILQWTIGLAPGVPTSFLSVGNSSDPLDRFLDTVNYISASDSVTHVLTTTHNSNENSISLALATKICNAYASLGTKGISVIFSSGDGMFSTITLGGGLNDSNRRCFR
jgi:tripeptidyl-peptidase-1